MFVDKHNLEIINNILHEHVPHCEVWAFGSRVHGHNFKKFSDLDIAVISENKIPASIISSLEEDFIESYLPFKVDVIDFATINDDFKKIIKNNYEVIQSRS